jgi:uncharacterized protein (DUF433 family)
LLFQEEIASLKANHESELESLKTLHHTEKEQVQAAINETEIKKLRQEAEVNNGLISRVQ